MTANEKNQAPAGTEDVSNDPPHIDVSILLSKHSKNGSPDPKQRKSHIETAIQQERTQQWEQASYHFNQNSPSRPTTPMKNATSESTNDPIASIHATLDPDPVALLQKPDDATRASPLASDDLTPDTDYKGLTEEERDSNAAMRAAKLRMYTYNRVSGSAPASLERYLGEGSTTEGSVEGRVSLIDGLPLT
ncbi:hypothetical protein MBLNU230_g4012t1 [Neophaeotheca triangularis]